MESYFIVFAETERRAHVSARLHFFMLMHAAGALWYTLPTQPEEGS